MAEMTVAQIMEATRAVHQVNPALYAKQVLGASLWDKQIEICNAVVQKKKVFVKASHGVGKSFVAACLVNWHFDSFEPSITITTAPNKKQVEDVLWGEVRSLRGSRGGHSGLMPKNPRMDGRLPKHFAVGETAATGDGFQGRHQGNIGVIFDEAVRIAREFYEATNGMMTNANDGAWWLAICNPTDINTQAYIESRKPSWHVMTISAMDHPNVVAALKGLPPPFPDAVGIRFIDEMVRDECEEIDPRDFAAGDIWWALPDEKGVRNQDKQLAYRPGPMMESRVLGRWPSNSAGAIWSDAAWQSAIRSAESGYEPIPLCDVIDKTPQIGCDTAWGGADYTSIVGQRGFLKALHYETHNGWDTPEIVHGLQEAAISMVQQRNNHYSYLQNYVGEEPRRVQIALDHDAIGWTVMREMSGWNVVTQSGMSPALQEGEYPNKRSEVWFETALKAKRRQLDLSALPAAALERMYSQAMAPTWKITGRGRQVEPKDETRGRIGRSPDDMDALNLAFSRVTAVTMRMTVRTDGNGKIVGIGSGNSTNAGAESGVRLGRRSLVTKAEESEKRVVESVLANTSPLGFVMQADQERAKGRGSNRPKRRLM